jgi:hypothetical protein
MLGKWERREATLQSLGVYYNDSEGFSENCPVHQDIGWESQTVVAEKLLTIRGESIGLSMGLQMKKKLFELCE